jgi:rubrerythrin
MKKKILLITIALSSAVLVWNSCSNSGTTEKLQEPLDKGEKSNQLSGKNTATPEAKTKATNDLLDAFKGESTASAKYAAFSKKAEQEGYHSVAMLFKAASTAEMIHAGNHKVALEESGIKAPSVNPEFTVKSTRENLEDAIKGETYEATTMYPEFLKDANSAGNQMALISLNYAYQTELKHRVFYEKALAALLNNSAKSLPVVYYVCPVCGNTYDKMPEKRCSICMTGVEKFLLINTL